jgi:hypothetical protein
MKQKTVRFIVLIPHQDAVMPLNDYKQKLFQAGFIGVYSFPTVMPLIITKKPHTLDELKSMAIFMRKEIDSVSVSKKFTSQITLSCMKNDNMSGSLGGFSFVIPLDGLSLKKDDTALPRFLLGLTVLKPDEEEKFISFTKENPPPHISFRACALANMIYSIDEQGACSWEIGHPVWLPSKCKETQYG